MKIFRVGITIHGTAYIRANSEARARELAEGLEGVGIEVHDSWDGDVIITGLPFDDPELPDVSLSPAMTIGAVEDDVESTDEEE